MNLNAHFSNFLPLFTFLTFNLTHQLPSSLGAPLPWKSLTKDSYISQPLPTWPANPHLWFGHKTDEMGRSTLSSHSFLFYFSFTFFFVLFLFICYYFCIWSTVQWTERNIVNQKLDKILTEMEKQGHRKKRSCFLPWDHNKHGALVIHTLEMQKLSVTCNHTFCNLVAKISTNKNMIMLEMTPLKRLLVRQNISVISIWLRLNQTVIIRVLKKDCGLYVCMYVHYSLLNV